MRRTRTLVLAIPWAWLALFLLAPTVVVLKIALANAADGVPPYTPLLHWTGGVPHLTPPGTISPSSSPIRCIATPSCSACASRGSRR